MCDPYLGSGTTAVEALLLGANFIGFDLSPLCVQLAIVKTQSYRNVERIRERVGEQLAADALGIDVFDCDDRNPIVELFLRVARMVTLSDVARRDRCQNEHSEKTSLE